MFLRPLFDIFRHQSVLHLAILQLVSLACILTAIVYATHWNCRREISTTLRNSQLRELAELAALHDHGGWPVLRRTALHTMRSQEERAVRITDSRGGQAQQEMTGDMRRVDWLEHTPFFVAEGATTWATSTLPTTGETFKILRCALKNGKYLWLAETERSATTRAWSSTWRIALMGSIIALIGVWPILWFTRRVHEPLERLMAKAEAIQQESGYAELRTRHAIPELSTLTKTVSHALNARVDQISTLSGELNSVNEHLAHELKTPLARIRGDLEDLLDHYGEEDGEEAAVRGMDEIDRASQLVQTILAIRLGDTGSMRLHLELTSPQAMITELIDMYEPAAEDKGQTLTFTVEQDALVLLDRHRVRQAIVNLLDNALAYTPDGGSIHLLQSVDEQGYLLRVQDTGPGLSQEDLERIWKRFVRGSAASARTPGTGLGLSLVRAVARAHYGQASAQNRPEGGSEFWIRLPLTPYPTS
jgi:signal transduction histidine kinase